MHQFLKSRIREVAHSVLQPIAFTADRYREFYIVSSTASISASDALGCANSSYETDKAKTICKFKIQRGDT
jgi:hypothetical protein